ncbi:MAG: hypothetical protein ACON5O_06980 [Lentimonas sp.]
MKFSNRQLNIWSLVGGTLLVVSLLNLNKETSLQQDIEFHKSTAPTTVSQRLDSDEQETGDPSFLRGHNDSLPIENLEIDPRNSLRTSAKTSKPDPILRAQMDRQINEEAVTIEIHPDGRRSLHLGNRFLHMSGLVQDERGGYQIRCYSSYAELKSVLSGFQPSAQQKSIVRQASNGSTADY